MNQLELILQKLKDLQFELWQVIKYYPASTQQNELFRQPLNKHFTDLLCAYQTICNTIDSIKKLINDRFTNVVELKN